MATQDAGLSLQGQPAWTLQAGPVCLPPGTQGFATSASSYSQVQAWKGRCRGDPLGVEESQHRNAPSL